MKFKHIKCNDSKRRMSFYKTHSLNSGNFLSWNLMKGIPLLKSFNGRKSFKHHGGDDDHKWKQQHTKGKSYNTNKVRYLSHINVQNESSFCININGFKYFHVVIFS